MTLRLWQGGPPIFGEKGRQRKGWVLPGKKELGGKKGGRGADVKPWKGGAPPSREEPRGMGRSPTSEKFRGEEPPDLGAAILWGSVFGRGGEMTQGGGKKWGETSSSSNPRKPARKRRGNKEYKNVREGDARSPGPGGRGVMMDD